MNTRHSLACLCLSVLCLAAASSALGLANRVFVSARSGNDANACDNVNTPCQTLQGAISQLNPNGTAIVLDSGGYGPVTISQGVTIEVPAGVTALIHPHSGDAITVTAGTATVTLRGLVLNVGTNNGITVNAVGMLNVENCIITGFTNIGIDMLSDGRLNLKGTDIKGCSVGVLILNGTGIVQVSIDHCHLDGNAVGYVTRTISPGGSATTASHTTANSNSHSGWYSGNGSSGRDVLSLEFCSASENGFAGLLVSGTNAQSVTRYSNCVFANNASAGVFNNDTGASVASRGNNTITGNGSWQTFGTIGTFPPM